MLGEEPVEVVGALAAAPTGVDETFAGQLAFPGGVLAQMDAGFRSGPRTLMEIAGTKGTILVRQPGGPRVLPIVLMRAGETEEIAGGVEDGYPLEMSTISPTACAPAGRRASRSPRAAATWPRSSRCCSRRDRALVVRLPPPPRS